MTGERLTLLAHAAATWYMVGLIWFVQVVHYPLFDRADRADFTRFSQDHQRLTTWVVGPPMLVEMLTALALVLARPASVPGWQAGLGLGLVLLIWASTALAQVPQHAALTRGYDPEAHQYLVASNWLRTLAWSGRGLLALWWLR